MKVVCESCQAKYQVPDERVAGKKLKIRCKRCGATVLIRGDLAQVAESAQPGVDASELSHAVPAAELEWHASIDGQSYGPFDTSSLLSWLDAQPGGWDAHVWRDGFSDWVEVRACPELMAAAPPSALSEPIQAATEPGMYAAPETDDEEGPTQAFDPEEVAYTRRPKTLTGTQSPDELRAARGSSIRTRSAPAMATAASAVGGWSSGAGASPRVTAAQAMTGERNEDSVLFSTANLQQVAMTNSQPGYGTSNPGFASGEASGLIDIRALASLAKQNSPQIAPGAAYDRFRADDDSRMAVMNQTGAFNRVDSLAPVSTTSSSSSAAVPLAILGGFALVAAAAFAAILITREAKQESAAIAVVPDTPPAAAAAQPTVTPEPAAAPATAPAAPEPTAAAPEPKAAEPAVTEPESDELAKKDKRSRHERTASEEKSKDTIPAEKAKPKKEKESPPPSSDEVMLAAKTEPKHEKVEKAEPAEPKPEVAKAETKHDSKPSHSSSADIDDLLAGTAKPAAKTAPKSRSIDDLLDGAADKNAPPTPKKEAAAPAAAAATSASEGGEDMPASPSRDEVLAAMRGVESAVRACATGSEKGTAEVQITVAGTTGRVTNATVTGITGEVGSCIARAARNAKFPRFSKPTFQVKYPYRFQ
jgi:predicted Zn finger-like uncharacterized protein